MAVDLLYWYKNTNTDAASAQEVKRAEDFEEKYNFRFEQKGSSELVGHARNIEGSVRQADTRRKEKRERKNERALSQVLTDADVCCRMLTDADGC